ncbi:hypothetical protein CDAR_571441 [Caerostris darwini]|uniref:Uncharacterized protein n=1 Tax=Caerostris darwini TaxID=1538125 RepID=A0AAV4QXP3_9ARAC|nr:hypothetical protein CDAR_571441 [Caerostris darwini]
MLNVFLQALRSLCIQRLPVHQSTNVLPFRVHCVPVQFSPQDNGLESLGHSKRISGFSQGADTGLALRITSAFGSSYCFLLKFRALRSQEKPLCIQRLPVHQSTNVLPFRVHCVPVQFSPQDNGLESLGDFSVILNALAAFAGSRYGLGVANNFGIWK